VAVGVVLRVLWPQGFLFRQDEAEHLADSFAISREGERPAHAWPSSAGLPNGPVYVYFLAGITRVTSDPRAAQGAVTLLNVAALALAVPLFRRWLPAARDATAAVALYATSPVAIWFSRKIWDPCLLPPLAVPALLLATRVATSPGSRAPALLLPLLATLAQVHQSGVFFAAVVLGAVAPGLARASRGALAAGSAAAAAIAAPYARHVAGVLAAGGLRGAATSAWPDVDVVTNLVLDATGHNLLQTAGLAAGGLLLWPLPPVGLLVQLALVPFAATFVLGFVELARPRAASLDPGVRRLLAGLTFALPALFLAARVRGAAHYYLAPLPVLFAVMVLGARRAAASSRGVLRRLPPPAALAGLGAASWILFQSYMSFHRGSASYGLPYADLTRACADVRDAARALGRGTPDAPLVLAVEVPRDRGPLPHQVRYVLAERLGIAVRAPAAEETPDLRLAVSWGDAPPGLAWPVPRGTWRVEPGR